MSSRRKSAHANSCFNFRPSINDSKLDQRGTKPAAGETSVKEVFTLMIIHICKKSIFFNTNLKVAIYLGALFLVSLLADSVRVPKVYLSRSDNIFNQYFVKFAWGWNLLILVPYVALTSYVYCCGQVQRIFKHHILRISIATFFWWFWTTCFNIIEANYGKCNIRGTEFNTKQSCLKSGYYWNGFDLSGHCFILIYGSLVMIEEARSMINWETIKDNIRLEEYDRTLMNKPLSMNPLRNLSNEEFASLKESYCKFTPYIRSLFIVITVFQVLWDVMLIGTLLYHHIMIEKFLGGSLAILMWYFTYKFWFSLPKGGLKLPGDGIFKYNKTKGTTILPTLKRRKTFRSDTSMSLENKEDSLR